jgi:hypothetical protein
LFSVLPAFMEKQLLVPEAGGGSGTTYLINLG